MPEEILPISVSKEPAKPGWKTTEFWTHSLVIAGLVLASLEGVLPAQYAGLAIALSQAAYSISRGLAKV